MAAGIFFSIGIRQADGILVSWGFAPQTMPTDACVAVAVSASAGLSGGVALRRNDTYAIGFGVLYSLSTAPPEGQTFESVSVGDNFACMLTNLSRVVCFGDDSRRQVSGAPNGDADDACAKAGIAAVSDALELE